MNNIHTNFQLSNTNWFREITLDRKCEFLATNFGVFGPLGGQKSDFEKSLKTPLDGHINSISTNFQPSNPYRLREIAADGQTDRDKTPIV